MKKKAKRMKVILLSSIKSLGEKGEVKNVSTGYARNFLIPRGVAAVATKEKIKLAEEKTARGIKKAGENAKKFQALHDKLNNLELVFTGLSAKEDKLYGSIGKKEIVEKIVKTAKITIKESQFDLARPLKEKGEYPVEFHLAPKIRGSFRIIIK